MVHARVVPVQHVRHDVVCMRLELHVIIVHGPRRVEYERQAAVRVAVFFRSLCRRGQTVDRYRRNGPPPLTIVVHPSSDNTDDRTKNDAVRSEISCQHACRFFPTL